MIRVLCIYPEGQWIVNLYRGDGALLPLERADREGFQFVKPSDKDFYVDVLRSDIVYFRRAIETRHLQMLKDAVKMNRTTVFDIDDDFFNVKPDSRAYETYQTDAVRTNCEFMLRNADIVTVSTMDLAEKFDKFRYPQDPKGKKPCVVIPNAIDDQVFNDLGEVNVETNSRLLAWRGGNTHTDDLIEYAPAILQFMKDVPTWRLAFLGFNPRFITKHLPGRCFTMKYQFDYYGFVQALRMQIAPSFMMIPLDDTPFNHSKSNIAALESLYAGALPICPKWAEWNIPGVLRYNGPKEFYECLLEMAGMSDDERMLRVTQGVEWMVRCRALSVVNEKRVQVFRELAE